MKRAPVRVFLCKHGLLIQTLKNARTKFFSKCSANVRPRFHLRSTCCSFEKKNSRLQLSPLSRLFPGLENCKTFLFQEFKTQSVQTLLTGNTKSHSLRHFSRFPKSMDFNRTIKFDRLNSIAADCVPSLFFFTLVRLDAVCREFFRSYSATYNNCYILMSLNID